MRTCKLMSRIYYRLANLKSLCQRCHMLHDRPHHLRQRWITYRRRYALGDLFLGPYVPGAGQRRPDYGVNTGDHRLV